MNKKINIFDFRVNELPDFHDFFKKFESLSSSFSMTIHGILKILTPFESWESIFSRKVMVLILLKTGTLRKNRSKSIAKPKMGTNHPTYRLPIGSGNMGWGGVHQN